MQPDSRRVLAGGLLALVLAAPAASAQDGAGSAPTGELVRYDRGTSSIAKRSVALSITPDNIRWGGDGMLYTAGGDQGPQGWSVVRVEPETLEARRIAGAPAGAALSGVSVGLPVGDEIWIGTFSGDRVGILPRP